MKTIKEDIQDQNKLFLFQVSPVPRATGWNRRMLQEFNNKGQQFPDQHNVTTISLS